MNLVPLVRDADGRIPLGDVAVPIPPGAPAEITVGFRPEHLDLVESGGITLSVTMVEDLGSDLYVYGRSDLAGEPQLVLRLERTSGIRIGDTLHVTMDPARVHLFDTATGERLD